MQSVGRRLLFPQLGRLRRLAAELAGKLGVKGYRLWSLRAAGPASSLPNPTPQWGHYYKSAPAGNPRLLGLRLLLWMKVWALFPLFHIVTMSQSGINGAVDTRLSPESSALTCVPDRVCLQGSGDRSALRSVGQPAQVRP